MAYNELEGRGTEDFPFAFFRLDENHARYHMAAHWHSEPELIRVLSGELHVTLNHEPYTLKKGDILFISGETVHQGTPYNCEYECIVFHADFLHREQFDLHLFIKNVLECACMVQEFYPSDSGECSRTLHYIFDEMSLDKPTKKFRIISAFYHFFALVYENNLYTYKIGRPVNASDKNIVMLKQILSYLRSHYAGPITLETIAGVAMRSPKYIGCFFKNMTGKTPIEYLNEYRVEKACHFLRCTDMPVTDIAYSCGFSDLSYFIKTFKRHTGISPGKYRNI